MDDTYTHAEEAFSIEKKKKKRKRFCVLHCLLFSYSKAPLCTNVSKWLDSFLSTTINYHSGGGLVIGNTASNKLS